MRKCCINIKLLHGVGTVKFDAINNIVNLIDCLHKWLDHYIHSFSLGRTIRLCFTESWRPKVKCSFQKFYSKDWGRKQKNSIARIYLKQIYKSSNHPQIFRKKNILYIGNNGERKKRFHIQESNTAYV